jgi:hypothetical protein
MRHQQEEWLSFLNWMQRNHQPLFPAEQVADNPAIREIFNHPEEIPLLNWISNSHHDPLLHHVTDVDSISIFGSYVVSISEDIIWFWDWHKLPPLDGLPLKLVSMSPVPNYDVDDSDALGKGFIKTSSLRPQFTEVAEGLALARMEDGQIYLWDGIPDSEAIPTQTEAEIRFGDCVISLENNPIWEYENEETGDVVRSCSLLKIQNVETGQDILLHDTQVDQRAAAIYPDASMIVVGDSGGELHFLVANHALRKILLGDVDTHSRVP